MWLSCKAVTKVNRMQFTSTKEMCPVSEPTCLWSCKSLTWVAVSAYSASVVSLSAVSVSEVGLSVTSDVKVGVSAISVNESGVSSHFSQWKWCLSHFSHWNWCLSHLSQWNWCLSRVNSDSCGASKGIGPGYVQRPLRGRMFVRLANSLGATGCLANLSSSFHHQIALCLQQESSPLLLQTAMQPLPNSQTHLHSFPIPVLKIRKYRHHSKTWLLFFFSWSKSDMDFCPGNWVALQSRRCFSLLMMCRWPFLEMKEFLFHRHRCRLIEESPIDCPEDGSIDCPIDNIIECPAISLYKLEQQCRILRCANKEWLNLILYN